MTREVAASLRHFVRLVAQEDVDQLRAELAGLAEASARLDASLRRLEASLPPRPSRERGTS